MNKRVQSKFSLQKKSATPNVADFNVINYIKPAQPAVPMQAAHAIQKRRPKATAMIDITIPAVAIPLFAGLLLPRAPKIIPTIPIITEMKPNPMKENTNATIPSTNDATAIL